MLAILCPYPRYVQAGHIQFPKCLFPGGVRVWQQNTVTRVSSCVTYKLFHSTDTHTLRKQEIYFSLLKIGKEISFFSLRTFTLENLQELSHLFKMPVFEDQRGLFFSWRFFFFPVLGLRDVFLKNLGPISSNCRHQGDSSPISSCGRIGISSRWTLWST